MRLGGRKGKGTVGLRRKEEGDMKYMEVTFEQVLIASVTSHLKVLFYLVPVFQDSSNSKMPCHAFYSVLAIFVESGQFTKLTL